MQPARHGTVAAELACGLVRADGLLQRICRVVRVATGAQGDRPQVVVVAFDERGEGGRIAPQVCVQQFLIPVTCSPSPFPDVSLVH